MSSDATSPVPPLPADAERPACLSCGGRGTLHARGGAATGTCPLPPLGCGGFGTVDAATRAAQEAQRAAPSALAVFYSSPSSPLVEAARILDAGLARPPGTIAPTPPLASAGLTVGAAWTPPDPVSGTWDALDAARPSFGVFATEAYSAEPLAVFRDRDDAEWFVETYLRDERTGCDLTICEVHRLTGVVWNSIDPTPERVPTVEEVEAQP